MFSRLTRLPLRRCLHTSSTRQSLLLNRMAFTLGTSAVAATYLTWHLTSDSRRIALDSTVQFPPARQPPSSPSDPVSSLHSSTEHPEPGEKLSPLPESKGSDASDQVVAIPTTDTGDESPQADTSSGGAYNPATGEINWDCPCLGGMAYGPCGPEFREAFSCFIFSEEEPKGINCVEKFKAMQNCFREHPEIYKDEITDDDDEPAPAEDDGNAITNPQAGNDIEPTSEARNAGTQKQPLLTELPPEGSSTTP